MEPNTVNEKEQSASHPILAGLHGFLPDLEAVYKDIHAHPELSLQETRTAAIAADRLRAIGYEVTTGIGKNGRCRLPGQCGRTDGIPRARNGAAPVSGGPGPPE